MMALHWHFPRPEGSYIQLPQNNRMFMRGTADYSDYKSTVCKAEEQILCRRRLKNMSVLGVFPTLNTKKVLFVVRRS